MTVSCNICRGPFGNPDELEAHIAADHFSFLPYECEKCPYTKFPTEATIRHHCENLHNQTDYAILLERNNVSAFQVRYRISPELLRKRRDVQGALRESLSPEPQGARAEDTNTTATTGQASPVAEGELKVEPTSDQEGMTALDDGPRSSGFDGYSTFDSTQLSSTADHLLQKFDFPEEESVFSNEQTTSTSADAAEMSMEVADSSAPSTSTANLWKALHRATYKPPRRPPTYKPAAKPGESRGSS
ncbi:Protein ZTF-9 [Aphelenchoides avenae]|nr:Protein ZTF-9 [Aphelenchus avenae]